MTVRQRFGGDWTSEKLARVKAYLQAYSKILSKSGYRFAYIDAFAGTGYREQRDTADQPGYLFPEMSDEEPQRFLDGSALMALEVEPPFDSYIFIEKSARKLEVLKTTVAKSFPDRNTRTKFIEGDANDILLRLCRSDWSKHRAVLFLDPFGMQVRWETIVAIARTEAIDLWTIFPLGVAINRMLLKNGDIAPDWSKKLDEIFGTHDWYDTFYTIKEKPTLFGLETQVEKTADFTMIAEYYLGRLAGTFTSVADRTFAMRNSKNIPLFLLCFAAGNPKGAPIAVRIARYLLSEGL